MTKARGFLSFLLLLAALVAAAAAISVCTYALGARPVILGESGDPGARAAEFLDHALSGRAEEAEACLISGSSLGLSPAPTDEVGILLYEALLDSFSFESAGPAAVDGTEAYADFTVTYLDLPSVTAGQKELTEAKLAQLLDQASRAEEVVNADGSYREDVAMGALAEVTALLLENAADSYVCETIRIKLIYSDNQWMVVPDAALFRVLAGNAAY